MFQERKDARTQKDGIARVQISLILRSCYTILKGLSIIYSNHFFLVVGSEKLSKSPAFIFKASDIL